MLILNTNNNALFAQRQTAANNGSLATALQRLSSGMRINSARDDAAGLAISDRMTSQIRGQKQGNRNISDAISLFQTAEGALSSVSDILQRGRELAVQASNASNSSSDRQALQAEMNQLLGEIDRISNQTEYNGIKLFDGGGSIDPNLSAKQAILKDLKTSWLKQAESLISTYYGLSGDGADLKVVFDNTTSNGATAYVSGVTYGDAQGRVTNLELHINLQQFISLGTDWPNDQVDQVIAHEMTHAVMDRTVNMANLEKWFIEGTAEFLPGGDLRLNSDVAAHGVDAVVSNIDNVRNSWGVNSLNYSTAYAAVKYLDNKITTSGAGTGIKDLMSYLDANAGSTLSDYFGSAGAAALGYADVNAFVTDFKANGAAYINSLNLGNTSDIGAVGGGENGGARDTSYSGTVPDTAGYTNDPLTNFNEIWPDLGSSTPAKTLDIQVGAQRDQTIKVELFSVNRDALGLTDVNLEKDPSGAISLFDVAIDAVSNGRSKFGATQNRLQSALTNNQTSTENLAASRSRVRDADFAAETARLTRSQILSQAATSMLAQANSQPQMVLSLLNGL